jgi:glucose/arabinose dehydrogenase
MKMEENLHMPIELTTTAVTSFLRLRLIFFVGLGLLILYPVAALANHTSLNGTMRLEKVASGLKYPVGIVNAGDGSDRLFIIEQSGRVKIFQDGALLPTPFLNLHSKLPISENIPTGDESGLLNIVFHPDFENNARFFVYYVDKKNDIRISEFTVSDNPNIANPEPVQTILKVAHPEDFKNHYGGSMLFIDGLLYIGVADGGGVGDPLNNSQNKNTLLAKILRIDIDNPAEGKTYGIPGDNPFVGKPGRDEIYVLGVRNPWRMSYDVSTQQLFTGDVGQHHFEEINIIEGGKNYGYHIMEGDKCYHKIFEPIPKCKKKGLTLPIYQYKHPPFDYDSTAIILGPMYRGAAIPALQGKLLFADFTQGFIDTLHHAETGKWNHSRKFKNTGIVFSSFGEDEAGEVYVVNYKKKNAELYKLVPVAE